mgnify:CR=1 FL=1
MGEQLMIPGIIDRKAENEIIAQRITDGYINATAMCKAAGKEWRRYFELSTTKAFVQALSTDAGLDGTVLIKQIGLLEAGGNPKIQGTWVHPQIAIHLAQWLSPKFAVLVSQWVMEWMSGKSTAPNIPYHLRRYMANMHNVPYGYFSILNEITLHLIGPLEQLGYTVSSSQVPDISVGKTFSKYLRDNGYPVDDYPKYPHSYEDGRVVQAIAYPNKLIGTLRKFFVEKWLVNRSEEYFAKCDPAALPYLHNFLALPNIRKAMGYIEVEDDKTGKKNLSDFNQNLKKAIEHNPQ